MVGQAVKHESAGFAAHVSGDGKWRAIRQSAKQSSVVRQTLDCCLLPCCPIDEDIRLHQIAKHQFHRYGTGGIPAQAGDDALAGPKVGFG